MSMTVTNLPTGPPARTAGVSAWVDIVAPAAELANLIALTAFVPKSFREKNGQPYPEEQAVAEVTACILMGAEIGIGPLQSLAKIAIIDGRPAPSAELARALLLRDGHDLWVKEATTTRVIMGGKRANSSHVQEVTWTLDDAKKAGLSGKQNWQRYPRQMLLARCSIELARMVAPDSLGGISVFAEEIDDAVIPAAGGDIIPDVATQVRKGATRKLKAAAPIDGRPVVDVELPPLPEEETAEAIRWKLDHPIPQSELPNQHMPLEVVPEPSLPLLPDEMLPERFEMIGLSPEAHDGPTDAQLRKLMATYNGLGIRDRADQKRITRELLDLDDLGSHKDLTVAQTSILIDMLVALTPDDIVIGDEDGLPYIAGSEPGA